MTAATVTTLGRSSGSSGSSCSRTAWFFASVRSARASRSRLEVGAPLGRALLALAALRPPALAATHRAPPGAPRAAVGVRRVADRADDHRAPGARGHDLVDVAGVDAADREPVRVATVRRRVLDQAEARRRPSLLGGRLPDRAGADLVGPGVTRGPDRGVELFRRVRREADQRAGAGLGARLGDRRVLLADVDAVGAAGLDQLRVVVDEEQGAVLVRGAPERLGQGNDLVGAPRRLLAQLDHVHAAAERRSQQRLRVAGARAAFADEVEAGFAQALETLGLGDP